MKVHYNLDRPIKPSLCGAFPAKVTRQWGRVTCKRCLRARPARTLRTLEADGTPHTPGSKGGTATPAKLGPANVQSAGHFGRRRVMDYEAELERLTREREITRDAGAVARGDKWIGEVADDRRGEVAALAFQFQFGTHSTPEDS